MKTVTIQRGEHTFVNVPRKCWFLFVGGKRQGAYLRQRDALNRGVELIESDIALKGAAALNESEEEREDRLDRDTDPQLPETIADDGSIAV